MNHLVGAALNDALDLDEPRAHHLLAEFLHHLRPDHDIGNAGFILQRHEHNTLGTARPLSYQHDARTAHASFVVLVSNAFAGHDPFFREHFAQEFHRMSLQ